MGVRRAQSEVFRTFFLRGFTIVVMMIGLAGCGSQPSADLDPVDVAVRVYVDRDADGSWSEGDIPLPEITVILDNSISAASNSEGLIRFMAVSQEEHTLALAAQDVSDLASHSLVCRSEAQTLQIADAVEIGFCFTAEGFLDVDVEEEQRGG